MRKKIVAGNWKMNLTPMQSLELVKRIKNAINTSNSEVVICPPFTSLQIIHDEIKDSNIHLGAQNFYFEDKGAFTGEVSLEMLNELGVKYVIIGHSERRQIFREDDSLVNKKLLKALSNGFTPILCCGETLEQRENNETLDHIKSQMQRDFKDVDMSLAKNVVIAYEPIWAIGTGKTATSEQAEEVCAYIRNVIRSIFNKETADAIRILYGGSVKSTNASEIFAKENIDGGLIGGASIKEEFIDIVNA